MEAAIGYQPARPARTGSPGTRATPSNARAASPGIAAVLDVLDVLDRQGPATLAQLARETGTAKSTLHRVCTMMSERGWVARDPRSGYMELGPRVAWLARAAPLSPLTAGFQGVARRLVARHNETTCLTVLDGRESVFIAKEETTHAVRLVTAVGSRLPAFAAASGRAMLAYRPEQEVAALHVGCELVTPTGRRLDGLEELLDILREARRRGYAENIDETSLGLHCLAAPVGPPGRVVAAITLCVPSGRMSAARKRVMLPDLLSAARGIVPHPGDGDPQVTSNPPLDGDPAPPTHTSLNQSNKLATLGASIPCKRGRRRPDPNRKVAQ
jgi:DNA-binding IclR family transcriptional regulator